MSFSGLAPSKLMILCICAYRVFYLPNLRRIEGGCSPRSLRYRKKRGPERVKKSNNKDFKNLPVLKKKWQAFKIKTTGAGSNGDYEVLLIEKFL